MTPYWLGDKPDYHAAALEFLRRVVCEGDLKSIIGKRPVVTVWTVGEMSPEQRTVILQRVGSIRTRKQARQYLAEVQKKNRQRRTAAQATPGSR